jgi:hypothetical protein
LHLQYQGYKLSRQSKKTAAFSGYHAFYNINHYQNNHNTMINIAQPQLSGQPFLRLPCPGKPFNYSWLEKGLGAI